MVYVKHKYGSQKKEITALLRKRLIARERLRYYSRQIEKYEQQEIEIEQQLKEQFNLVKGNYLNK